MIFEKKLLAIAGRAESWRTQIPSVHSASELAARYKQLIKAKHPDKVAQLDPEVQAIASERSRRIIEAYETISAGEN